MKTKVHATNSLVRRNREIPEVVQWYIADRLLEPTKRLNELLNGTVSRWVDELRDIRGTTRLSSRVLKELNRTILSIPERLGYDAYHAILDVRLWRRWRRLRSAFESSRLASKSCRCWHFIADPTRNLTGPGEHTDY